MTGNKTIKNIISISLALLFCWHIGSITLFPHVHVVGGVTVCHSHPFTGSSDNPGHTHSQVQYETIASLSLALFILAAFTGILLLFRKASRVAPVPLSLLTCRSGLSVPSLRGPPFC